MSLVRNKKKLFRYLDSLLVLDDQEPLFYRNNKPTNVSSPPGLHDVVQFNLGSIDGVNITFTGSAPASVSASRILEKTEFVYTASAEASPDATRDGAVAGTVLGLVQSIDFSQRDEKLNDSYEAGVFNFLSYANGTRFLYKTEGVTIPPGTGFWKQKDGVALIVLDMDNPNVPSQMCLVQLEYSTSS